MEQIALGKSTNGTLMETPCRHQQGSSQNLPGHCVRLAERADTLEPREKLLHLAREWMQAVMDDEDAERLARSSSGDGGRRQVSGTRGPGTELDSRTELERTRARFRSSHFPDHDHGNHSSRAAPGSSDLRHNPVVAPEAWTHPGGPRGFHTSALAGGRQGRKAGSQSGTRTLATPWLVGGWSPNYRPKKPERKD